METNENIKQTYGTLKNVLITVTCTAVVALGYVAYEQNKKNLDLEQQVEMLEGYNNEAIAGFAKIESNLMSIREREGSIMDDLNAEGVKEENAQLRIDNEIKAIEGLINENKSLISQLKLNLGDKDKQIEHFTASVNQLEKRVKKYKEESEYFHKTLLTAKAENDSLNDEVAKRDFDLYVKNEVIDLQADHLSSMNTEIRKMDMEKRAAYFAVGSFEELKNANVVEKQGGILGLGSTKALKENFDRDQFVKIDKLDFETIPVFAKNAEIISNHDRESYELELTGDDAIAYIRILDPEKFWENTRYLVVVTKGSVIQS